MYAKPEQEETNDLYSNSFLFMEIVNYVCRIYRAGFWPLGRLICGGGVWLNDAR